MSHSRKKLDLTGQRFGKLTVLAPAENVGSRTAWLCRCDCGRESVVKTYRLRSGHTSSCGCRSPQDNPQLALGLTYWIHPVLVPWLARIPAPVSWIALASLLADGLLTAALLRRSGDTACLRWYSR